MSWNEVCDTAGGMLEAATVRYTRTKDGLTLIQDTNLGTAVFQYVKR